jgi:hypothetical protein
MIIMKIKPILQPALIHPGRKPGVRKASFLDQRVKQDVRLVRIRLAAEGVTEVAVLHFLEDADDPAAIVAALAGALAPGSFVAVSHLTADFAPEQVAGGVAAYNDLVPARITARTHRQICGLFGGLALVAPGVVPVTEWRPDHGCVRGVGADVYAATRRPR